MDIFSKRSQSVLDSDFDLFLSYHNLSFNFNDYVEPYVCFSAFGDRTTLGDCSVYLISRLSSGFHVRSRYPFLVSKLLSHYFDAGVVSLINSFISSVSYSLCNPSSFATYGSDYDVLRHNDVFSRTRYFVFIDEGIFGIGCDDALWSSVAKKFTHSGLVSCPGTRKLDDLIRDFWCSTRVVIGPSTLVDDRFLSESELLGPYHVRWHVVVLFYVLAFNLDWSFRSNVRNGSSVLLMDDIYNVEDARLFDLQDIEVDWSGFDPRVINIDDFPELETDSDEEIVYTSDWLGTNLI